MSTITENDKWTTTYRALYDIVVRWHVTKDLVAVGQSEDLTTSFQVFKTNDHVAGQALQGFQIDATATWRVTDLTREIVDVMAAHLMSIINETPGTVIVAPQITDTIVETTPLF